MRFYFITFRSVTYAQRAEKLLTQRGIRVSLMRTPRWMEEQGCGYSLRLRHQDALQGTKVLKENRIAYRKVYLQGDHGSFEELEL